MHAIIDEMNKTFLRFNDAAVQAGVLQLNPGLARELKQMQETFANCVKSAKERTLDSDEEEFGEVAPAQKIRKIAASATTIQPQSPSMLTPPEKEQVWHYTATSQATGRSGSQAGDSQSQNYFSYISSSTYSLPETNNQPSLTRRRQSTVGEVLDQSRSQYPSRVTDGDQSQEQQQQQPLPFGLVDLPSREESPFVPPYIFPVNIPAMGAELPPPPRPSSEKAPYSPGTTLSIKTLSSGYTYSYDEVTFARRLLRATIETGFRLLSNGDAHPALLNYIFKLSLPYLTLDEIRDRFKTILSRGVTEDLDWYATPFLHLGGAGTHYQRYDAQGKPVPMKNTWSIRQIGPLDRRMIRLESVADGQTQDLDGIDLRGFEGEWFDAHDVQGYLEEQWNCRIDPKSSFAECLIDENSAFSDNETESQRLSRGSTASTIEMATPPIPHTFNTFEPSYGLDTSFGRGPTPNFLPGQSKQNLLDLSFDQTLGLDLAPGFDMGFASNNGYHNLGLSMMSETKELPVVRQKPKKVAWVDVQKLIDSKQHRFVMLRWIFY